MTDDTGAGSGGKDPAALAEIRAEHSDLPVVLTSNADSDLPGDRRVLRVAKPYTTAAIVEALERLGIGHPAP